VTAAVPPDVGELRRLEAAATEGPWFRWFSDAQKADHIRSASREWVAQFAATEADAALIAALRNSARWLLGQAEAVERVRERLAKSDWIASAELLRILDEPC
jgi:hypothetical protein